MKNINWNLSKDTNFYLPKLGDKKMKKISIQCGGKGEIQDMFVQKKQGTLSSVTISQLKGRSLGSLPTDVTEKSQLESSWKKVALNSMAAEIALNLPVEC